MTSDVNHPWFSGLRLQGELAGQYALDRAVSKDQAASGGPAVLELDGLAPITIFVGANNSGKSRLLREIFKAKSFSGFRIGMRQGDEAADLASEMRIAIRGARLEPGRSFWDAFQEGWIVDVGSLNSFMQENLPRYRRNVTRANDYRWDRVRTSFNLLGINESILAPDSHKRCYIPMLRGMRPPMRSGSLDGQGLKCGDDWYRDRPFRITSLAMV
jgi:hypothetical protein